MPGDQQDYVTVDTATHRVEKDIGRTLQRVGAAIVSAKQRLGADAIVVLTLTTHVPRYAALPTEAAP